MEESKTTVRFVTISGFPNYCVGEDGRVWSDNRKRYLNGIVVKVVKDLMLHCFTMVIALSYL